MSSPAHGGTDGADAESPKGTQQRPRAPTISIDDSAVNSPPPPEEPPSAVSDKPAPLPRIQTSGLDSSPSLSSPFSISPTDVRSSSDATNRESRPTSPHNVSSPRGQFLDGASQNFLAVPGSRQRATSMESQNSASTSEFGGETQIASTLSPAEDARKSSFNNNDDVINDTDALTPDPGTEEDFKVENNPFAFSPGQLNKMINPKNLAAFHALGGLGGLEKGLRTNRHSGLSVDEVGLEGSVDFREAVQAGAEAVQHYGTVKRTTTGMSLTAPAKTSDNSFADRKRVFKDNRLPEKKAKTFWQLAWIAYNDKVLILLSVAAVISLALGIYQTVNPAPSEEHEAKVQWVEGVAIMVAIFVVTFVGALNDYQKERQFVKLNRKKEERFVKVVRSGKSQEISVYDVLVGDVMHLEPGDLIPVDGVFIDGHNVRCDESSATGESDIIRKTAADEVYHAIENHQSLKKMDPFILSGGKVSEGVGTFLVTATGVNSSYGKTLMSLQDEGQTTPLQMKLNVLAEYIAKLGLAAGLLLFVVLFIKFLAELKNIEGGAQVKGQRFLQIFIVAVTIIVVAVPEGLPLAVTLALAFATTRMLKDNNLVRLLRACETMGNATTVCSDKTGTLTQNKMTVVAGTLSTASRFGDKQQPINSTAASDAKLSGPTEVTNDVSAAEFYTTLSQDTKSLLKDSIILNSTAFEGEEDGKPVFVGSKTETALLQFVVDHLPVESIGEERANADIAQMVPFDSGRKCMAVVIKLANGKYRMLVKGASEILISKCSRIISDPTKELVDAPISSDQVETLNGIVSNYASRSLRTIALLYRDFSEWPPRGAALPEDKRQADFDKVFKDMIFLGVVGIQDPLRPGVEKAVRDCQMAGVFVRMVTGDNIMTAKAIATECGIFTSGGIAMEGPVFRKLSSKQLTQVIPRLQVLARSSPDDKKLLVGHLKKLGETVAVTGDGTNDAPALKTADVGFSMGIAGTEVAKEASAIILMDDNFASIVKAISWGRTVNDAVKKFLQFQITVNITAVFLTFISAVANDEENSVLTAVQLLWVNLIMDTFAALALATDPPSASILKRRPEPKSAPLITLTMWKMIIGQSIYQLVVTLVLYFAGNSILSYQTPGEQDRLHSTIFNTFVWMQIFNQYNSRRLDNKFNIFEGVLRNYWFVGIQFLIVGGQILIMFVGGQAFSINRINGPQWGYSLVLGALSVPVAVIIRLIPDELFARLIPPMPRRKKRGPEFVLEDDENEKVHWNPALEDIREELQFLKRIRGGRISELTYKLQHPKDAFLPRSRSPSRSRSNSELPQTPDGEQAVVDTLTASPSTPEKSKRRARASSNSVFGPATAMAGIIAGSVAGGWSPIERRPEEQETVRFTRSRSHSGVEGTPGMEIHPATPAEDPVFARTAPKSGVPPSQDPELAPHFDHAPPHSPSTRSKGSHSRSPSSTV
ncbi:Ca2+-transporting ATPase [Cladophialophora yegresii CBS 114405]|uniref:Calcium-transporting ATPase n=1 Tax=Cladophialophora yegresii CBS 114405 TaxID=1182544 RepID=W9W304_9EURO|nr:Ca2+-transporting ATPase [Cladophialophora yegresii CBS 114405]EXJ58916.1 Ca2+-transporting ATPase [Cladophialophora yegresii CBS 114405]